MENVLTKVACTALFISHACVQYCWAGTHLRRMVGGIIPNFLLSPRLNRWTPRDVPNNVECEVRYCTLEPHLMNAHT